MSEPQYADPDDPTWWYNIHTGAIEHGRVSPGPDRLGPFTTKEQATRALDIVKERARKWEEEDAREDGWGTEAPA